MTSYPVLQDRQRKSLPPGRSRSLLQQLEPIMADAPLPCRRAHAVGTDAVPEWRAAFLAELAATSNVAASARHAGISPALAYQARRAEPGFYREWQEALCEGYDMLEMALLRRLREGEVKPAAGAKKGVRTFDNANALRLLAAHRESTARQRAVMENRDSDAILDAIDAKIEKMRERSLPALPAPGADTDQTDDQ